MSSQGRLWYQGFAGKQPRTPAMCAFCLSPKAGCREEGSTCTRFVLIAAFQQKAYHQQQRRGLLSDLVQLSLN